MMLTLPSVVLVFRHLGIPFRIRNFDSQLIGSIGMFQSQLLFIPVVHICGKAMPFRRLFMFCSCIAM